MKFVIDTSVAVKWFLSEVEHETAVALLATRATFHAPDLLFTEFATAMQKKIRLGEADRSQADLSCASLPSIFSSITPTLLLFERALDLAIAIAHPVQDCIFLACAERDGLRVITADLKLIERASEHGLAHLVLRLGEAVAAIRVSGADTTITPAQLEDILRLNARVDATLGDLTVRNESLVAGFHFLPASVYSPAFSSPAFLRLRNLVASLTRDQLRDLVALCWLGRGYDGADWSHLRGMADRTIDSLPGDLTYVLSLLSYLPAGLDRARPATPEPTLSRDA
ncbi:PIN domain-containing protein [Methylobacterium sp. A54F]